MKNKAILFSALFLLMLITGVFWGTWFTLTRSLDAFSADEFIHIGKIIIANVAWPMRIIMPSGIILMFISLWLAHDKKTVAFRLGVASFILIVFVLLVTLLILVPIDNNIKEWTTATIPIDWPAIRDKWDFYHTFRTFASLASFAGFSLFLLLQKNS